MKFEILPRRSLSIEKELKRKSEITAEKTSEQLESKQEIKECLLKENEFFNTYLNEWAKDPQFTKYGVEISVAEAEHFNQIPKFFKVFVKALGEENKNCLFAKLDPESHGISTAFFRGLRQPEKLEKHPEEHNVYNLLSKYIKEKEITPSPHGRDIQNKPGTISVTSDPAVALSKDSGEKNYATPEGTILILDREVLNKIPHQEGISTISEISFERIPLSGIKGIYIGKEHAKELIERYKGQNLFAGDKRTIEEIVIPHNFSESYSELLKENEEYFRTCFETPEYSSGQKALSRYSELRTREMDIMENYRKESLLKIISFLIPEPEDIKTLLEPKYNLNEGNVSRINECLNEIKKERSRMITFTSIEQVNKELKQIETPVNTKIREIEEILFNAEIKTPSRV